MKKVLIGLIVVILILFGIFSLVNHQTSEDKYKNFAKINYQIESRNLKLLVADTPEKWERGLMFFRKLDGVDGTIFIFPNKQYRTFWNKNTFMNLDILWIDGDKVVGKSYLPSIEKSKEIVTVKSSKPADKVIEIPAKK